MRTRRVGSIKTELLTKSREAALAAIQIFNNPSIGFKSEAYIVLMIIAWTYLLHAYFRDKKIEYRYYKQIGSRKKFNKTKYGAYKCWELEQCLNNEKSPIDKDTSNNLKFLIGLRHEIEHQMTTKIDDILSARFQACCLNYNTYIKKLFGNNKGIEKQLAFSLQFSSISEKQKSLLEEHPELPPNIRKYIINFDENLANDEFQSNKFSYRVLFVPKLVNRKGQADRVIEFIPSNSSLAENINKEYAVIHETEKKKYTAKQIVDLMHQEGYGEFRMYDHIKLFQQLSAKDTKHGYGVLVANKDWRWYEKWVTKVREHCAKTYTLTT